MAAAAAAVDEPLAQQGLGELGELGKPPRGLKELWKQAEEGATSRPSMYLGRCHRGHRRQSLKSPRQSPHQILAQEARLE